MNLWLNLYWPNAFIWDTFNVQIIYPLAKKYNELYIALSLKKKLKIAFDFLQLVIELYLLFIIDLCAQL